ncbi:hypothetical protein, partial [Acinetobacter baumannii]
MTSSSAKKKSQGPITISEPVSDLADFIAKVMDYAAAEPLFKCYRGQRDSSWENIPGLFRPDLKKLEECEKRAIRDLISVHPH